MFFALGLGSFAFAFALTAWLRSYALRRGMLDVPNHRSSHSVPTPRGGGLSFVIVIFLMLVLSIRYLPQASEVWIALLGGGIPVATIGWFDDKFRLPSSIRFATHAVAAAWAVYWLGGLPRITIGTYTVALGVWGSALAWLGTVWSINLYNFMDGIDGLAAGEGVLVSLAGALLLAWTGSRELSLFCWVLATAVSGFLAWNWHPAKIFMGDVGSGLLGFVFATLALASENQGFVPVLVWIMLLGVFAIDSTATLLRRIIQKEKWYAPHRSHAYQLAVRLGYNHNQVTSVIMIIDLGLITLAILSVLVPVLAIPSFAGAVSLLLILWWHINKVFFGESLFSNKTRCK